MKRPVVLLPKAGGMYVVGPEASIQFGQAIAVRVIHVTTPPEYSEFCWLDVYELGRHGDAERRREIYVRPAALVGMRSTDTLLERV